ncbi:hypothetical protein [Acidovorax cavernicola]|uniref:Uncharacterized protein n=1 Tax=Acidovorax cavernicola TaxID=1675792 RepID=A0A9X8D9D5_9BURK|nr:hypothetical protein [Acidovorax cavernicola]RIX85208.1 hypothetical protein D3H34_01355 [Acidovorax cavernicola]
MTLIQANFLVICFAVGVAGALLGLCVSAHRIGRQFDAQRRVWEIEREQTRQMVRAELAQWGLQQAGHHEAQRLATVRWQAEQDARRQAEWQALWREPQTWPARREEPPAFPQPVQPKARPSAPVLRRDSEPQAPPVPHEVSALTVQKEEPAPERELSDEEIDALPPELPVATRVLGRKLPAPKGPVLRQL